MLINPPTKPLQLRKTVAGTAPMDEFDAVAAKEALWRTSDYTPPFGKINPIPENELIGGIRGFQKRRGLREDGEMKPGGPTERLLRASLGQSPNRRLADGLRRQPISGSVGAAGRNTPDDKKTLKDMLTLTGQFDPDSPAEDEDFYLAAAIRNLQSEFGLPRTSTLAPGDEAETALRKSLALHADGDPRDPYNTPLADVPEQPRTQVAQAGAPQQSHPTLSASPRAPKRPDQEPPKQNRLHGHQPIPHSAPSVPVYRQQGVPQSEVDTWHDTLKQSGVGENQYHAYMEFFIAEGGEELDTGSSGNQSTFAGITNNSVRIAIKDGAISAPAGTLPEQLTGEERIMVLNHLIGKPHDSTSIGGITGGATALERIEDRDAAVALIDVILGPHDSSTRIKMVQEAIEDVAPGRLTKIDGLMGDETFDAYADLAKNPDTKRALLDALADRRIQSVKGDPSEKGLTDRFNHFRFTQ